MGLFDFFRSGPSTPSVDVAGLKTRIDSGETYLIDVRSPGEYAAGHVAQARLVPLDQLAARLGELPKDREIFVICQSGGRSLRATETLAGAGLKGVNVAGGTGGWIAAGFPVVRG
jgi:rhodanese-related sulfurtransferase